MDDVAAIVVTHQPPPGLRERLDTVAGQTRLIIVIDNGPREQHADLAASLNGLPGMHLVANGTNLGIAAALNQGLRIALDRGVRWALLLDHDSTPQPGMLKQLRAATQRWRPHNGAVYVPRIRYTLPEIQCRWPVTQAGARYRFKLVRAAQMAGEQPVDLAISSGMLVDLRVLQGVGLFREGLFIDLVDTEFCLRLRRAGFLVVAVPSAELHHSIGNTARKSLLGVRLFPTHHAPIRHYYLARNRVHLWRLHGRALPSWAVYELLSGVKLLGKSLLFEHDRLEKMGATIRGTLEGLMRRPPVNTPIDRE